MGGGGGGGQLCHIQAITVLTNEPLFPLYNTYSMVQEEFLYPSARSHVKSSETVHVVDAFQYYSKTPLFEDLGIETILPIHMANFLGRGEGFSNEQNGHLYWEKGVGYA
jgi:hypothetical protein